jgi:tRNA-specific 2-thiouridylase
MSGGVDSSVAALLLRDAGYDVVGVTLDFFGDKKSTRSDNFSTTIENVKRISKILDIPHIIVDAHKLFDKKVVRYLISEYRSGRTPNPCIVCNTSVKFHLLLLLLQREGADFFATGHYARIDRDTDGHVHLLRGRDKDRDQSYFLFLLHQRELVKALFPLGDLTKKEVRRLAEENGIVMHDNESRELCFLFGGDYRDFIASSQKNKTDVGYIVDEDGNVLGKHEGFFHYTVGQRKKIGVPSRQPYYVLSVDPKNNRVMVGFRERLLSREVMARSTHWISGNAPETGTRVSAMVRYNQEPALGDVSDVSKDSITVLFDEKQFAPAPGQGLVLYNGERVLGGGFIV